MRTVICIDGPAGSGKSTVAHKIAKNLGLIHLNSGALFRAVAFGVLRNKIDPKDSKAVVELARSLRFEFRPNVSGSSMPDVCLAVNGNLVGDELFAQEVSSMASEVAVIAELRDLLLEEQRAVARKHSVVVEGRDSGTIVFPDAPFKFFLEASLEARALRRFYQLNGEEADPSIDLGTPNSLAEVRREIALRDKRDESREIAPQQAAEDAIRLDTSELSIDDVVSGLLKVILEK